MQNTGGEDAAKATHIYTLTLFFFTPFMHLYLWGAESRDFASIIAG